LATRQVMSSDISTTSNDSAGTDHKEIAQRWQNGSNLGIQPTALRAPNPRHRGLPPQRKLPNPGLFDSPAGSARGGVISPDNRATVQPLPRRGVVVLSLQNACTSALLGGVAPGEVPGSAAAHSS